MPWGHTEKRREAGRSRVRFLIKSLNPSALSLKPDEGIVPVVDSITELFVRSEEEKKKCMWQGLFLCRTEHIQTQTYIVAQNRTRTHDPRVRAVENTTKQGPRGKCNQQFHIIRKMLSTGTSVHVQSTRSYIPEDGKFLCFIVFLFKQQFRMNFTFWCW